MKMLNLLKKYKKALLILAETACIFACLLGYKKEEIKYQFHNQSMVSEEIYLENFLETGDSGYYMDSSMEQKSDFVSTPEITLKPGLYKIVLYYQADGVGQAYMVTADNADFREWIGNYHQPLPSDKTSYSVELGVTRTLNNFEVQFDYSGDGYFFVTGVDIIESRNWIFGLIGLMIIIFAILDSILWNRVRIHQAIKDKKKQNIFVGLAFIVIFASIPLFCPYLFYGHDLEFHLLRIEGVKQGLLSGQFPVRIQPNWMNGYGYGVSMFYGDILLYIPAMLRIIGFDVQTAYKSFILIINIFTAISSYYCFRRLSGNDRLGIVGALLYTTSVYRLNCIYTRSAVGEYTALSFLPFILVGMMEILFSEENQRKKDSFLLGAAGFSGVILTHIISCETAVLLTAVICIINFKKLFQKKVFTELIKMTAVTLILTAWFLVPFLDMYRGQYWFNNPHDPDYIQTSGTFISQLFTMFPQAGGESLEYTVIDGIGAGGEFSFALGGGFLLIMILFLLYCINSTQKSKELKTGKAVMLLGIIVTFMTTIYFPWNDLQRMSKILDFMIKNIQFPWRLLGLAVLLFSFLGCLTVKLIGHGDIKKENSIIALIAIFAMISSGYMLSDRVNENFSLLIKNEDSLNNFHYMGGEYLPANASIGSLSDIGSMKNTDVLCSGVQIHSMERNYQKFIVECESTDTLGYVDFPLLYYKGYEAKALHDNEKFPVQPNENGYVRVNIPQGYTGSILVDYKGEWYWKAALFLSLAGTLMLIVICLHKKGKKIQTP